MQYQYIDGTELHRLFTAGYRNLKKNMAAINDLNVFPVPDGDTGTNMVRSFGDGLKATPENIIHAGDYMARLSRGVLLSARGNSGVIFSQFIHGLARGIEGKAAISFADLAVATHCAMEDAYRSVISPTEGTILTLIRESSDFLDRHGHEYADFASGFKALVGQLKASLAKTPQLLPVLAQAGVVDSGGAGLLCFAEGIYACLCGQPIEDTEELDTGIPAVSQDTGDFGPDSVLEFGYCTEFILQLMHYKTDLTAFDLEAFLLPLKAMGDSIVAVHNSGIVKIHIHTFTPEKALEHARHYGEFISVKIENMSIQHSETQAAPKKERMKYAIVAVAAGQGIMDYFYSIGANAVIDGGQTNNPPVDAFLEAFRSFDAEHIVVLPNNSNITLTAQQAAQLYTGSHVVVIPTKSIVEGYSALSMMDPGCDTVEEFVHNMAAGLDNVTSAYVTTAIRDALMDGQQVLTGEWIGLENKTLIAKGTNRVDTAAKLIDTLMERSYKDVIIVFYGQAVSDEEASELEELLQTRYPAVDLGFVPGKQSIYDFIISLE